MAILEAHLGLAKRTIAISNNCTTLGMFAESECDEYREQGQCLFDRDAGEVQLMGVEREGEKRFARGRKDEEATRRP